jgi:uncharacterized BrkB/YihY/UPF0761 family membrane protein
MTSRNVAAIALSGIAGGLAWCLGMIVIFGSVQFILTDPTLQSAKFNVVFQSLAPLPRSIASPWIMPVGLIGFGLIDAWVYSIVRNAMGRTMVKRGALFGVILWLIMAPWFEFYLPWNVMWEPASLVALELLCWFGVMQLVGHAIVQTQDRILGQAIKR